MLKNGTTGRLFYSNDDLREVIKICKEAFDIKPVDNPLNNFLIKCNERFERNEKYNYCKVHQDQKKAWVDLEKILPIWMKKDETLPSNEISELKNIGDGCYLS